MRLSTFLLSFVVGPSIGYTLPLDCAVNNGIMTTLTYGTKNAIFTACAQDVLKGSPSQVYEVLLDFPRYPAWNTFCYSVDLPSNVSSAKDVYIGMPMTFHTSGLTPPLNSTSAELITYLELEASPPFAGWRFDPGQVEGLLIQAEHLSVLQDLGNGSTKYVSWETYYGAGSLVLDVLLKSNLQKEFVIQGSDLKARMEALLS
jgi:hypothetical protein